MNEYHAALLKEFKRDMIVRGKTKGSANHYGTNIRMFLNFLEERELRAPDVQKTDLIDYIALMREKELSDVTLANNVTCINSLYKFLLFHERITVNLVPMVRERYLGVFKKDAGRAQERKVPELAELSDFLNSILSPRDKAMGTLFAKTGIRSNELISIDLKDIDWDEMSIKLKRKRKRSNLTVFFDSECRKVLQEWLIHRDMLYVVEGCDALFIGQHGKRLQRTGVYKAITYWAKKFGLYDTSSPDNSDHFSAHNLRHCFTTYLREKGVEKEYVQELRGDKRKDAIDIYHRISKEKLKKVYQANMPAFGV